jgi:hypothetical protein
MLSNLWFGVSPPVRRNRCASILTLFAVWLEMVLDDKQ